MALPQLLILAGLGYLAYRLLRPRPKTGAPPPAPGEAVDEMVEDPQCGVYFPKSQGFAAKVDGQRLLFCSEACRQAYLDRYTAHDVGPDDSKETRK